MRDALNQAKARYDELTRKLEDPAVHSNPAELKRVSKERSPLEPLIQALRRYDRVLERIQDDSSLLKTEKDPELAAMAKAEIEELSVERDRLEAELPRLLLPPDPLDQKNVIVEIRAG